MYSMVHRHMHVHRMREVLPPFYGIPARQQAWFAPYSVGREMISSRVPGVAIATNYDIWLEMTGKLMDNKCKARCVGMDCKRRRR